MMPAGDAINAKTEQRILDLDIGGDGVSLGERAGFHSELSVMDIAANGDIYYATPDQAGTPAMGITIYRSTNGGTDFTAWGRISGSPNYSAFLTHMILAEGDENRCYVAYIAEPNEVMHLDSADLADPVADFDRQLNLGVVRFGSYNARIAADDDQFPDYYLYVAYEDDNRNVMFTRSTDQGTTWETPYSLNPGSSIFVDDISIDHGSGFYVHVVWREAFPGNNATYRYRRADNDAQGGIGSWGVTFDIGQALHDKTSVMAAPDNDDVVVRYGPNLVKVARDQGDLGFAGSPEITLPGSDGDHEGANPILRSPTTGDWYTGYQVGDDSHIFTAQASSPSVWTYYGSFLDETLQDDYGQLLQSYSMALDPTHDFRIAVISGFNRVDDYYKFEPIFNAEWRTDPGFPLEEPGFPYTLPDFPISDPAIVDVVGDAELEIVVADSDDNIHLILTNGVTAPGWPVNFPNLSSSPVAIGRLTGDVDVSVVAGTTDGRVVAFDPQGDIRAGWPVDLGTDEPVHLTIGNFDGPSSGTVVAASGQRVVYLDRTGQTPTGAFNYETLNSPASHPPAVGDVDEDGVLEVVVVSGSSLRIIQRNSNSAQLVTGFPATISGAPTLGDADLDGDLEIAVPTSNGTMHMISHTGSNMPGWPYTSSTASSLSSASWAHIRGTGEPELAFSALLWTVHLVYSDGVEAGGYPVHPDGSWILTAAPAVGRVEGLSGDVVTGDAGRSGWAWDNFGQPIGGWPRDLGGESFQTPAIGDLDLDGSQEVVFADYFAVHMYDLNEAPSLVPDWAMAGHDPARTGCYDCPDLEASSVDDEIAVVATQVKFALPYPNPMTSGASFQFTIPSQATVSLEVFDIRGRRVRLIERGEMSPGSYNVGWNGLDSRNRPVGDGMYYARLRVQGPDINETVVRKVNVLR